MDAGLKMNLLVFIQNKLWRNAWMFFAMDRPRVHWKVYTVNKGYEYMEENKGEEVSGGFFEFDGGVEYISNNWRNSRLRFSETGIFYRHRYCDECNISKSATA